MGRRTGQALSEQVETVLGDEVHPWVASEIKRSPTGGGVPLPGGSWRWRRSWDPGPPTPR